MLLLILIILVGIFGFWLMFKFFKFIFRFMFCMIFATLVGQLILKYTSYTIDIKGIVFIAIIMFILSVIMSNASDGISTFWEDFVESRFVQILIGLFKITFRFAVYMIIAALVLRLVLKYTSYTIDNNNYYLLGSIALFILSVVKSNLPNKHFGFRRKSNETEYTYISSEPPKNYVLNSKSGIIHSKWDSSADEISEEHKIPLSNSEIINLMSRNPSIRFKRDN